MHVGRLDLDIPAKLWVQRFVQRPGIERLPLSDIAASQSYDMQDLANRDPVDRLLIATAIERGCPLVTYDLPIIKFAQEHGRQAGFSVVN